MTYTRELCIKLGIIHRILIDNEDLNLEGLYYFPYNDIMENLKVLKTIDDIDNNLRWYIISLIADNLYIGSTTTKKLAFNGMNDIRIHEIIGTMYALNDILNMKVKNIQYLDHVSDFEYLIKSNDIDELKNGLLYLLSFNLIIIQEKSIEFLIKEEV